MKQIIVKYQGECRKCGTTLVVGEGAVYEKRIGIFCTKCAPADSEDIRTYRQEAADRKADRYEGWASKRKASAEAKLNSYPEIRHDWAFITQPGRIPFRDRMNQSDSRAYEGLRIADKMQAKADSLRHVRVKGDAEKRWQDLRDFNITRFKVGDTVNTGTYGNGTILKINKKTAKIGNTGTSGTYTTNVDLAFLSPVK